MGKLVLCKGQAECLAEFKKRIDGSVLNLTAVTVSMAIVIGNSNIFCVASTLFAVIFNSCYRKYIQLILGVSADSNISDVFAHNLRICHPCA